MAIDMFDTRSLLGIIRDLRPLRTPFLDMFFKEVIQSETEFIQFDFVSGTLRIAPFVGASVEGKPVDKKNWSAKTIQPPYIKIKDVTTAIDVLKRMPGETIYQNPKTPAQRARKILQEESITLMDMIIRRIELMAHTVLTTQGAVTFSGEGISVTIDFGMLSSHKITLTSTDVWSDTTNSKPLTDLRAWARLIKNDSGKIAKVAIMDTGASDLFMDHPTITGGGTSVFDTRRADLGVIDPKLMPSGLEYIGSLKKPRIDLYEYSEIYEDSSGTQTPIMTANTVLMGALDSKCVLHYGAIKDLDARAAVKFFPKSWKQPDPSQQMLLMQSAPLPAPHQINAFVSATVV